MGWVRVYCSVAGASKQDSYVCVCVCKIVCTIFCFLLWCGGRFSISDMGRQESALQWVIFGCEALCWNPPPPPALYVHCARGLIRGRIQLNEIKLEIN